MIRAYLDTNVFLDCFLAREPHGLAAAHILQAAARGQIKASTSAVSICNMAYILGRLEKSRVIERDLHQLLQLIHVVPNTGAMLGEAIELPMNDFEDAIQYGSARQAKCTHFITANKKHFRKCSIQVLDPSEFLRLLSIST